MNCKKIFSILVVLMIIGTSIMSVTATDDLTQIKTDDTKISFNGNDVMYDGQKIGNITNIPTIEDAENMIQDKDGAIKEVYHEGLEYLTNDGQYYIFESNGGLYVMFIEESNVDIAADCKTLCGNNHEGTYFDKEGDVPGALDENGFDLDVRNDWMI